MGDAAAAEDAVPSKKNQRYDRQLRLWGDHGQDALSSASILCVGATAVGTEILKNLVLPGIGAFTLLDPANVSLTDCGSNFFVSEDRIGEPRAKVATEYLLEMNEYVKGEWIQQDCLSLIQGNPEFLNPFTVVIAVNQLGATVDALAKALYSANTPLLVAKAYGNVGFMQIVVKEHCVVEYHADTQLDMRLTNPFAQLTTFMDSIPPLSEMETEKADGIPYGVVLYQHLQQWKAEHDGNLPSTYADKKALKAQIKASQPTVAGSIKEPPLNLVEAVDKLNPSIATNTGLQKVTPLLERSKATPLNAESNSFWIMVDALRQFVDKNGELPLHGAIPDMHADSDVYVALQRVYIDKAAADVEAISGIVSDSLQALGKAPDAFSEAEIKRFCQNAGKLFVLETPEYGGSLAPDKAREFDEHLSQPNSEAAWMLLLWAADKFHAAHGHYPGHFDEQVEEDIPKLKECVQSILEESKIGAPIDDDCIHEMCRWGGAELHSVASLIGGSASQEVVKLVTKQYAPLDSVFVYNGTTANCKQFKL
eukprot:m.447491 g.447491  ORF g.447491 m.447491 type:complete len:537 (-) comp19522_c0_seq1:49-1659(-)